MLVRMPRWGAVAAAGFAVSCSGAEPSPAGPVPSASSSGAVADAPSVAAPAVAAPSVAATVAVTGAPVLATPVPLTGPPGDFGALPPTPPSRLPSADGQPSYEIDQAFDDLSGTLAGKLTLRFPNPTGAPLVTLPLLLHPNAARELGVADSGSLDVETVTDEGGAALRVEQKRPTLLLVHLPAPVAAGDSVVLRVTYRGRLRRLPPNVNDAISQAMASLGSLTAARAADYGLLALGDGLLTAASAYPMAAPYRDGAFDTSPPAPMGDLAYNGVNRFRTRTVVPAGMHVVTNLVDAAPVVQADGSRVVTSEGTHIRDLVLVGGRDLSFESQVVGDTRVTSYFRVRDAEAGRAALHDAVSALGSFERRFGDYPYPELDIAEASLVGGAGGVEFSGMVLIAGMLYKSPDLSQSPLLALTGMLGALTSQLGSRSGQPGAPAPDAAQMMKEQLGAAREFTVAHEVAHQYFAGLVGNDSHTHPSLDEPIAQYAAGLAIEDRHGAAAAKEAMDGNVKMNYALYRLLGGADRPVLRPTASFQSSIEYAGLVYGKAPYAYVALRKTLGDNRLHGAIKKVVDAHRFELVTTETWVDELERAAGGPSSGVRRTLERYFGQAHGDGDLGVDGSGDFVLQTMFPPEMLAQLKQGLGALGMDPATLLRTMLGSALAGAAPVGPGLDPSGALQQLPPR